MMKEIFKPSIVGRKLKARGQNLSSSVRITAVMYLFATWSMRITIYQVVNISVILLNVDKKISTWKLYCKNKSRGI